MLRLALNRDKKQTTYFLPPALILAVSFLLFFYSPFAPIYVLSLCITYVYLARKLSVTHVNSKLLLVMIALFTHTTVFGLFVIIFSAVSNISLHIVLCIVLLVFSFLLGYEVFKKPDKHQLNRPLFASGDITSIIIGTVTFFLLAIVPLINLSVQKQHSSVLTLTTGNVDSAAHLAIYNDYLGFNDVQPWGAGQMPRSTSGGFYPSSWHAANASLTNLIAPHMRPGALSAAAFGFLNVFWISVLVYFSTRLAFTLYEDISSNKKMSSATYTAFLLMPFVIFYFFDIHILRFGFFSFIPQLIAILVLIYCLRQTLYRGVGSESALGLAILYCSISLASWILLLPVAAAAVIITIGITMHKKHQNRNDILVDTYSNWPLYLIAAASAVAQFYLILTVKSGSKIGPGQGLLLDGGTPIYDMWVYALLFAGLVSAILYTRNRTKDRGIAYEPILIAVVSTLVFACFLFAYQTYHTGATHYYYYKSVLLIPTLLAPLCIAMVGIMLSHIKDSALAIMVAVAIPVAFIQIVPSDRSVVAFVRGSRTVSSSINNDVWAEMHDDTYPTKKVTAYFVNSGSNETSTIATLLVQANRPNNACFTSINNDITFMSLDMALEKLTTSPLPGVCNGYTVKFKVDQSYATIIKNASVNRKYKVDFVHE